MSDTQSYEANEETKYVHGEDEASIQQEHVLNYSDNCISDFAKFMIAAFKNFQMNTMHTDMTVKLSDENAIKTHQVVLAAGSPYFEALVRRSSDEENEQTSSEMIHTDLLQLDPVAVKELVKYIYSNKIEIANRELLDYIHGCDFLQLGILLQQCKSYAEQSTAMSQENCFQWFVGGKLFSLPNTKDKALSFICYNFVNVHKMEGLLNLGHEDITEVLNNSALGSIPEQELYEAITFWIMHNQSERSHLTEFLKSNAMNRCSVDMKLELHAILRDANFDVNETHPIWEAHYARLAQICTWLTAENTQLQSSLSQAKSDVQQLNCEVIWARTQMS